MEIRKRTVEQIERDLYWARHVANHGTSVDQRERGKRNVEIFEHELTVAQRETDYARVRVMAPLSEDDIKITEATLRVTVGQFGSEKASQALRRVIDVARQTLPAAAGLPLTPAGNGFLGKRMRNVPPQTGVVLQSKVHGGSR